MIFDIILGNKLVSTSCFITTVISDLYFVISYHSLDLLSVY